MEEEIRELKRKLRSLNYRYDDALLGKLRAERETEKWKQKYHTAIIEYSNIINKQAELGIELEGKIKELEANYEKELLQ